VSYADGQYVAVGGWRTCDEERRFDGGPQRMAIFVSSDGTDWDDVSPSIEVPLQSLAWAEDGWVAVGGEHYSIPESTDSGQSSIVMTSADGRSWEQVWQDTEEPIGRLHDVAFGSGRIVALGYHVEYGNYIVTSDFGDDWFQPGPKRFGAPGAGADWQEDFDPRDVTYGAGVFLLTGEGRGDSIVAVSEMGRDWTLVRGAAGGDQMGAASYVNGRFIVEASWDTLCEWGCNNPGESNMVAWSGDGRTWDWVDAPYFEAHAIAHDGEVYVAVSDEELLCSDDGESWERVHGNGRREIYYGVTHGPGGFVAVGGSNREILNSADGRTWDVAYSVH